MISLIAVLNNRAQWFLSGISCYQQDIKGGGGTVENYLPFYCHQGEGGHKKTKELAGGGGVSGELFRVTTKFLQRRKI